MSIVFIENLFGSGQIVTIAETFNSQTIERKLKPGESGRFMTSAFKSIVVNEGSIENKPVEYSGTRTSLSDMPPYTPVKLTMVDQG